MTDNIISIFGEKGIGKTYSAISTTKPDEKTLIISFDGMSEVIRKKDFNDYKNIEVYNVMQENLDKFTNDDINPVEIDIDAGMRNVSKLKAQLELAKTKKYDWIIIDGYNIAEVLGECIMRKQGGLKFGQGVANLSLWKIRNTFLNAILNSAKDIATIGVIYTLYTMKNDILRQGVNVKVEEPNYIGEIKYRTLVVIEIKKQRREGKNKYTAYIETSKLASIKTGDEFDISGRKLNEFIRKK